MIKCSYTLAFINLLLVKIFQTLIRQIKGARYRLYNGADEKLRKFLVMEISTSRNRLNNVKYYQHYFYKKV